KVTGVADREIHGGPLLPPQFLGGQAHHLGREVRGGEAQYLSRMYKGAPSRPASQFQSPHPPCESARDEDIGLEVVELVRVCRDLDNLVPFEGFLIPVVCCVRLEPSGPTHGDRYPRPALYRSRGFLPVEGTAPRRRRWVVPRSQQEVPLIDIEIQTNLNVSGIKRDCGQSRRLSYSLAQALIQEGLGRADNSPRGR